MKKLLIVIAALFCFVQSYPQHTLKLIIKDVSEKKPLPGATAVIASLNKTAAADSTGTILFTALNAGSYSISVTHIGKEEKEIKITVPLHGESPLEILLEESEEHGEEIIISATRTKRSIEDIPTRVETISGEELTEKANMKPGDIRMMLNESTGIQTQQTSATSYNSSIRIQGLDGRYTQLLRDGLPLYAGFSGGLSLMQIAPLDLKQVEVIKGSASTLYGGGAIAGLVNLVSKIPEEEREISFLVNGTSALGLDLSGFYSQKFKKTGFTFFGSSNTGTAYDPADIGLTAIPEFQRYTFHPRIFLYGEKTTADIGVSYISENRTGGSMNYIKDGLPGYFEKNNTSRITSQAAVQHVLNENSSLEFKTSYTSFKRKIAIPTYVFDAVQQSSYSELSLSTRTQQMMWNVGVNFLTDDLKEEPQQAFPLRDYHYNTFGLFIQNTWSPVNYFSIETGLRSDYVKQYGVEFLPRLSAMLKLGSGITMRLGGGLGYKTPTVFNEEAERIQFQHILPIDQQNSLNEKSAGGNFDINYRTHLGELRISVNQLFFYTRLNKPLVLVSASSNDLAFVNANGHMDTKGWETNLRLGWNDFKLFVGYTYADVNTHYNDITAPFPLTARHRLNNVLMYELEEKLKMGFEAYYYSPQQLNDGATGKSYWILGFMAEKLLEKFSIFLNFENLTDTRQTRFDTIYTGPIENPTFRDIYAPVDGFVVNGGFKIRL